MTTTLKVARRKLTATAGTAAAINAPQSCIRLIGVRFGKDWQSVKFLGRIAMLAILQPF